MIVDAHAHAAQKYANATSIIATIKENNIDKVVLCPSPKNNQQLKEPPNIPIMKNPNGIFLLNKMLRFAFAYFIKDNGDGNQYINKIREEIPNSVIPFIWVNPLSKEHMESLEGNIAKYHAKGIKLHQCWNAFKIDGPEFAQLMGAANSHNIPIFIHLYSKKDAIVLGRIADKNRSTNFIIAHMLGLDVFQEYGKKLENIYFDTSGSERVREEDIQLAINNFGYEKVIFGTDTPYADIQTQINKINRLKLKGIEKEHIMGKNIQRILSIG
jgi:predicted TIM-barrel fold metal-dependent hydrolase